MPVGQTAQFTAIGTYGNANHPSKKDITSTVTWSSSAPGVATVSSTGLATAVGAGSVTITATAQAYNGPASSSANMVVTATSAGGGGTPDTILSLTIIPNDITVGNLQDTGQFLAIGTFSTAPAVRDLTNSPTVTWISSLPERLSRQHQHRWKSRCYGRSRHRLRPWKRHHHCESNEQRRHNTNCHGDICLSLGSPKPANPRIMLPRFAGTCTSDDTHRL